MKILGLTCSASACELNWSTFDQVHTKRRNRLSTNRMNSLVYNMYNKKVKHKHLIKQSSKEVDDPLIIETLPSDDEWVANPPNDKDEDEDETRVHDIDDMIELELEDNVAESLGRPNKRKRNRRKQTSRKGYCQKLNI